MPTQMPRSSLPHRATRTTASRAGSTPTGSTTRASASCRCRPPRPPTGNPAVPPTTGPAHVRRAGGVPDTSPASGLCVHMVPVSTCPIDEHRPGDFRCPHVGLHPNAITRGGPLPRFAAAVDLSVSGKPARYGPTVLPRYVSAVPLILPAFRAALVAWVSAVERAGWETRATELAPEWPTTPLVRCARDGTKAPTLEVGATRGCT